MSRISMIWSACACLTIGLVFQPATIQAGDVQLALKDLSGDPLPTDAIVTFQDSAGQPLIVTRLENGKEGQQSNQFTVRDVLEVRVDPKNLRQIIPNSGGIPDKSFNIRFARTTDSTQFTNSLTALIGSSSDVQRIVVAVPAPRASECTCNACCIRCRRR